MRGKKVIKYQKFSDLWNRYLVNDDNNKEGEKNLNVLKQMLIEIITDLPYISLNCEIESAGFKDVLNFVIVHRGFTS